MTPEQPLALAGEFPPAQFDEWRQGVDRVLAKGKSDLGPEELAKRFNRELVTQLYDGIAVSPLYTSADIGDDEMPGEMPGFAPFVRSGSLLGGMREGWDVRQPVDLDPSDPAVANLAILENLERGATSVLLRAPLGAAGAVHVDASILKAALEGVYLDLISVALDASLGLGAVHSLLELWASGSYTGADVAGVLGLDPIGEYAATGGASDLEGDTAAALEVAGRCAAEFPKVRSIVVDATRYHEAGCSDSEELACAIATGVAYLRFLTDARHECGVGVRADRVSLRRHGRPVLDRRQAAGRPPAVVPGGRGVRERRRRCPASARGDLPGHAQPL